MNALVAKEIRQMRPALAAALLLAVVPVWLYPADWESHYHAEGVLALGTMSFCIGWLLLALTSFGREFGMGTFPVLLALPVTRKRIWWTKISVLLCAMAIALAAAGVSAFLWCDATSGLLVWDGSRDNGFDHAILVAILASVVIVASGLWTTLFLRQMLGAFWCAIIVPLALLMVASWNGEHVVVGEIALGIYAFAGFFLARRLFYQAQEVGWTGGEVNLPALRSASAAKTAAGRSYHPLVALIGKELQLYKIPLAGMAAMFLLHLGTIIMRQALLRSDPGSQLASALSTFGGLWFLVPLVIGGISITEERRMGTMEAHLCLPVSRRVQFFVKLFFSLLISGILCGSLLWLGEYVAASRHVGGGLLVTSDPSDAFGWRTVAILFPIISFVVFYASTLSRNLLQHIAVTVGIIAAFIVMESVEWPWTRQRRFSLTGLYDLVTWPAMFLSAFFLSYFNFRRLSEARRLWLRNLGTFACLVVVIPGLVMAIYYRPWEYLTPLEPAHGPAKPSLASGARMQFDWRTISVFMADGKLWSRHIAFKQPKQIKPFGKDRPVSLGIGRWIMVAGEDFGAGSNWVSLAHVFRESVAIRADGTLWISEKPQRVIDFTEYGFLQEVNPHEIVPMVRIGEETDWKDLVQASGNTVMLLKRDGTLWLWGNEHDKDYPGLARTQPVRAGADSDWARFLSTAMGAFVWKNDGRAWEVIYPGNHSVDPQTRLTSDFGLLRQKTLDNMNLRRMAWSQSYFLAAREDGTLWMWGLPNRYHNNGEAFDLPWKQVGTETNWVSVAGDWQRLVALKRDGTLWQWNTWSETFPSLSPFRNPPMRLGSHNDWVALGSYDCALAADGSLWLWNNGVENSAWFAPRRKPYKLGNVFEP